MNPRALTNRHWQAQLPRRLCLALLPGLLWLGGCGGGGGIAGIDSSGAPVASNQGTIDGFGSVIVNGLEFHSDKARIQINGQAASELDLHAGYQVSISGTLRTGSTGSTGSSGSSGSGNQGDAESVDFRPDLVGVISQIDTSNQTLVALGQSVQVKLQTLFDPAINPNNLNGLALGQRILVSGLLAPDGSLQATRIELSNQSQEQLSGLISDLTASSFKFHQLSVDFTSASFNGLTAAELRNGLAINVLGSLSGDTLVASRISPLHTTASDSYSLHLEGLVTRFVSAADFDLAGRPCTAGGSTQVENGQLTNLALGAALEVSGTLDSQGRLQVQQLRFDTASNRQLVGQVSAITITEGTSSGIAVGQLTVNGTLVTTNTYTTYEDDDSEQLHRFGLRDIQLGDYLVISGQGDSSGFSAGKIEREDANEYEPELQGQISEINMDDQSLVVFGTRFWVTQNTEIHGNGSDNLSLADLELLWQADPKLLVHIHGNNQNGQLQAEEIELAGDSDD